MYHCRHRSQGPRPPARATSTYRIYRRLLTAAYNCDVLAPGTLLGIRSITTCLCVPVYRARTPHKGTGLSPLLLLAAVACCRRCRHHRPQRPQPPALAVLPYQLYPHLLLCTTTATASCRSMPPPPPPQQPLPPSLAARMYAHN